MRSVDIGIGHDDDLVIPDLVDFEVVRPDARPDSRHQRSDLVIVENLVEARLLDVQHLAAQPWPVDHPGQRAQAEELEERRKRTKEKLRGKLVEGDLDAREVQIETEDRSKSFIEIISGTGLEEMGVKFPEGLDHLVPKRKKGRTVTVDEAKRILAQEEKEKLVDMDRVVSRAVRAVEEGVLGVGVEVNERHRASAAAPGVLK